MNPIVVEYQESCLVGAAELEQLAARLHPEIERLQEALGTEYSSEYASINLPIDDGMFGAICDAIEAKQQLVPTLLVVIGIGGSNLGTMALQEAVYGKLYNQQQPEIKIYYADTVDSDYIYDIALLVDQEFQKQGVVMLNVISKSGTTTETIANFELLLEIFKAYYGDMHHHYIIATTDKDSALWKLAQQEQYTCLEVPKNVGGRYSVFSAVGLFPLGLIGIDIEELLDGARQALIAATSDNFFENSAAITAALLYTHYKRGIEIHDTFLFSVDLETTGKWYRQLMGESIGKEFNRNNERVEVGIVPTVSVGSTDLHSVAQLYLGGPHTTFTSFVYVAHNQSQCAVPQFSEFEKLVPKIQGKPFSTIMAAIFKGTQQAYRDRSNPFVTYILPDKSAHSLGEFMQLKMCEMIYLGFLLDINPFDQPSVEKYKTATRKILAYE